MEEKLEKRIDEVEKRTETIFKKLDELSIDVREAKSLSQHSYYGYVEMNIEMRNMKELVKNLKNEFELFQKKFPELEIFFTEKLNSNLKWNIATIIAVAAAISAIIKVL